MNVFFLDGCLFLGGHLRLESSCIQVNTVNGWLNCLPSGCFSFRTLVASPQRYDLVVHRALLAVQSPPVNLAALK
jgi:hypothetical protein